MSKLAFLEVPCADLFYYSLESLWQVVLSCVYDCLDKVL